MAHKLSGRDLTDIRRALYAAFGQDRGDALLRAVEGEGGGLTTFTLRDAVKIELQEAAEAEVSAAVEGGDDLDDLGFEVRRQATYRIMEKVGYWTILRVSEGLSDAAYELLDDYIDNEWLYPALDAAIAKAQGERQGRIDAWVVALDDTRHYNFQGNDRDHIEQILSVYAHDANTRTHVAEAAPSYFLEFLYSTIVFRNDTPDEKREELLDRYVYSVDGSDNTYMHVSDVERLPLRHHYGAAENLEEVREWANGNPPF